LTVGADKFANVDIRLRVSGGGHVSQMYALRQAIAKGIVAYYAKNEDAASALELKKALIQYDRTLLVADPRRMEPKKVRRRAMPDDGILLINDLQSSSVVGVPEQGDRNLTVKELSPSWVLYGLHFCTQRLSVITAAIPQSLSASFGLWVYPRTFVVG
jgi:hypothetical protein